MQHFLCILTLCLTQAIWLSSSAFAFSEGHSGLLDAVNAITESPESSLIEPEIEESEFIGHSGWFDVNLNRPEHRHEALAALPVPSRPIDARGCRPPPSRSA
ncbi:MAG: hypothetical protein ACKO2P_13120 [Planctomycetota bacterium]